MSTKKAIILNFIYLLIGLFVAFFWISRIGGEVFFEDLTAVNPIFVLLLIGVTVFFVFVRFIRWQFLLRRVEIRLPTRPS